jgi:hypothetical protein
MMNTKPATYRAPSDRTEMTGQRLREASVRTNNGETIRLRDGQPVSMLRWYDCGDGGDIQGNFAGTIIRIARGTERGMHGDQTLLVTVKWDRIERGTEETSTFAARHLDASRVK